MAGIFLLLGVLYSHFDTIMLILTVIFLPSPKSLDCISRLWGAAQQLDLSKLRSHFHNTLLTISFSPLSKATVYTQIKLPPLIPPMHWGEKEI
ncbi:hypothetical protein A4S05_04695 [Nostoc sp. KVJ20]|nr:hypothetical protein A4S05_04695 [Nostoc sp. KVJ20]